MIEPLAIVDPALGASGAHNAGLASLIAHRYPDAQGNVAFWGSARTVPDSVSGRVDAIVERHPLFHTDFFALIKQSGTVAEHWPWIRQLSAEYLRALEQIAARWPGQNVRVLHHTLSWEHASALTLALRMRGSEFPNQLHLCFLMYSPGVDRHGDTIDGARRLRFTQAFRSLSQLRNVRLFAACSEYADAYRHLLELPHAPPLHPCFLVEGRPQDDPSRDPSRTRAQSGSRRSILYMGVIKKEKGFFRLPDLLGDLRDQAGRDDELIIQFVRSQKIGPKAEQVIADLQTIAATDPRVRIHDKFWDEITLSEQMAQSHRLFLDYDPEAYRHKTSGLLWLGAWHRLQIVLPRGTWLEREAIRLGADWVAVDHKRRTPQATAPHTTFEPTYRAALFYPFLQWLQQQTPVEERWLLCRPHGGTHDILFQIKKCYDYAKRFRRSLLVDTRHSGLLDTFGRYFRLHDADQRLALELSDELCQHLNRLDAWPPSVSGRLENYTWFRDAASRQWREKESGDAITFDFNKDHPQTLLVHQQPGGGRPGMAIQVLAKLEFQDDIASFCRAALARLPADYVGIHVRNTDYQTDYKTFFSNLHKKLAGKNVLVCSDDAEVKRYAESYLTQSKVYSVADIPDTAGKRLHGNRSLDPFEMNRAMLVDLLALACARELLFTEVTVGKSSGFSRLARDLHERPEIVDQLLGRATQQKPEAVRTSERPGLGRPQV